MNNFTFCSYEKEMNMNILLQFYILNNFTTFIFLFSYLTLTNQFQF